VSVAVEYALENTTLEVTVYQGQLDLICDVVGTSVYNELTGSLSRTGNEIIVNDTIIFFLKCNQHCGNFKP